jgi:hypothetical protein
MGGHYDYHCHSQPMPTLLTESEVLVILPSSSADTPSDCLAAMASPPTSTLYVPMGNQGILPG